MLIGPDPILVDPHTDPTCGLLLDPVLQCQDEVGMGIVAVAEENLQLPGICRLTLEQRHQLITATAEALRGSALKNRNILGSAKGTYHGHKMHPFLSFYNKTEHILYFRREKEVLHLL
jgi:hypothetical protein